MRPWRHRLSGVGQQGHKSAHEQIWYSHSHFLPGFERCCGFTLLFHVRGEVSTYPVNIWLYCLTQHVNTPLLLEGGSSWLWLIKGCRKVVGGSKSVSLLQLAVALSVSLCSFIVPLLNRLYKFPLLGPQSDSLDRRESEQAVVRLRTQTWKHWRKEILFVLVFSFIYFIDPFLIQLRSTVPLSW